MEATINPVGNKIKQLRDQGYCILKNHFDHSIIEATREMFWPVLLTYLNDHIRVPNRGINRYFLPMPFERPCFAPEFFFDKDVLYITQQLMGDRIVADQWSCDVPIKGSEYQNIHVDFQRELFSESPDLQLPPYILIVSFGLATINSMNGAIEIASGTHRMNRKQAFRAVEAGEIKMEPISLEAGDVLIRHPWALHRGTPNLTETPRALISIRYVRHWYCDNSREVNSIPVSVWESLSTEQQSMMRFPIAH
jgi:hypothetical protein